MVNFDVTWKRHVFDSDEKNALIDKVKFLEHDCCEKDKLIKLLKQNKSNNLQELDRAKESIKRLTISFKKN